MLFDYRGVFLNGTLEDHITTTPPRGGIWRLAKPGFKWRLRSCLYGLKLSGPLRHVFPWWRNCPQTWQVGGGGGGEPGVPGAPQALIKGPKDIYVWKYLLVVMFN
jgi:hypothetical protein